MKTLKNHTILYDEACPMCTAYTNAFVKTGMLDEEGRKPYQTISSELAAKIDCARAVNEIALINRTTGEVEYGIKSLFTIMENSFPVFRPLFRCRPFASLMDKVYKFISYNRRVIMPSAKEKSIAMNDPAFHLRYRLAYLVFTWLISAFILFQYSRLLIGVIPAGNFYRELLACGGQIFWQLLFVSATNKTKSWDYLGAMMTISLAGSLLLLIAIGISPLLSPAPFVFAVYFALVVLLMLAEHIRRTKILKVNRLLTLTWVVYRIILLIVIVYVY